MFYSDRPDFDLQMKEQFLEMRRMRKPKCACCDEHIQQESAVKINGYFFCDRCLDEMREELEEDE